MTTDDRLSQVMRGDATPLSEELLTVLRHRVATRFYEHPTVAERVAQAIVAHARTQG